MTNEGAWTKLTGQGSAAAISALPPDGPANAKAGQRNQHRYRHRVLASVANGLARARMMERRGPRAKRLAALGFALCCTAAGAARASAQGATAGSDPGRPRYDFTAEIRFRAEGRSGAGPYPAVEDAFGTSRLRLNFTGRAAKHLNVFVQLQDSQVGGLAEGRNNRSFRNTVDFRQAYASIGSGDGPLTLDVGRRELGFFGNRLLGGRDWSNTSPTWDGSMLTLRRGDDRVFLLAFSQVDLRDGLDVASRTRFVYGAIGSLRSLAKEHAVEPFLLSTRRPRSFVSHLGGLVRTAGSRFTGKVAESWDYEVIVAAQGGGGAASLHRAWMGHWAVHKTISQARGQPKLIGEYSYASGDDDPLDGRNNTFDQLAPSPHRIYGEADVTGFRNLKAFKAGVQFHPHRELRMNVDFFDFRLASQRDGLYRTNNTLGVGPPPAGASSSAVGSELDVVLRYSPTKKIELRLGVSRFFAGEFVTANVANGESQTFLSATIRIRL